MKKRLLCLTMAFVMIATMIPDLFLSVSADSAETENHYRSYKTLEGDSFVFLGNYYIYDAETDTYPRYYYYMDYEFNANAVDTEKCYDSGDIILPAGLDTFVIEEVGSRKYYASYSSRSSTTAMTYKIKTSDGRYLSIKQDAETLEYSLQLTSEDPGAVWIKHNYGFCQLVLFKNSDGDYYFGNCYNVYVDHTSTPKFAISTLEYNSYDNTRDAIQPWYKACNHTDMVKHDAVAVTCTTDGAVEYYTCPDCDGVYADIQGKQCIYEDELVIFSNGHNDSDGDLICDDCRQTLNARKFEKITSVDGINENDEYIIVDANGNALSRFAGFYDNFCTSTELVMVDGKYDYYAAKVADAFIFKFVKSGTFEAYGFSSCGITLVTLPYGFDIDSSVKYGTAISFSETGELKAFSQYGINWEMEGEYLFSAKQGDNGEVRFYASEVTPAEGEMPYTTYGIYLYRVPADTTPVHEHSYGEWEKHDATQHKQTCECGDVNYENHTWDNGTITTQPTHTSAGVKTFTCTLCGETKTESVEKLTEHTYGDWTKKDDNKHIHTCECGATEEADHSWKVKSVTSETDTYECEICGGTKTETHTHSYGAWAKKDDDEHIRTCGCGETEIQAHNWEPQNVIFPTHLSVGYATSVCTVCGATKTDELPKLQEHTFGEWAKKDSDVHIHTCECGEEETEPHDWKLKTKGNTEYVYECEVCGATKTEAHTHTFGEWKPSATEKLTHYRECECGATERENHTWDNGVITVVPTRTTEGKIVYTCTVCGATKEEILPPMLVDEDTGIRIQGSGESTSDVIPEGAEIKVEDNTESVKEEVKSNIAVIADDAAVVSAFEINLEKGGTNVQPNGDIQITLPIPEKALEAYGDFVVVYIDDDGNITPITTVINEDGTVSFTINHLSCYAIVGKDKTYTTGDVNGDDVLNSDDAIYTLRYVMNPESYPVNQTIDFNNDGKINSDDAIYLLRHVMNPEAYPIG